MPQTLAQKLIAKAAGRPGVEPDEIVTCRVDLAMMHDLQGPRRVGPMLEKLGAPIKDPDRLVVVSDHFAPAIDVDAAGILDLTRKWAKAHGIRHFYDMQGISHILLPERGHLRPGMFFVGGDSHTPTGGAVGCFAIGVGSTEICGVIVTGEIWVRVPRSIRVNWSGKIGHGVSGKDMMLKLCGRLSMEECDYRVIEYRGDAIAALPMGERLTLCNMSPELGAKTSVIAPDRVTIDYLAERGVKVEHAATWQSDPGAEYEQTLDLDGSALQPQVSAPGSPSHSADVGQYPDVAIDQAYIGACTGAKLSDLDGSRGDARAAGGARRALPHRACLAADDRNRRCRWNAGHPHRGRRDAPAYRLRGVCRHGRRHARRRRGLHRFERAQLQGAHGRQPGP